MQYTIEVLLIDAGNCWNAYSNSTPGLMATGKTKAEAFQKFRKMAVPRVRESHRNGWLPSQVELAWPLMIEIPEEEK